MIIHGLIHNRGDNIVMPIYHCTLTTADGNVVRFTETNVRNIFGWMIAEGGRFAIEHIT